jgi:regulatory protein
MEAEVLLICADPGEFGQTKILQILFMTFENALEQLTYYCTYRERCHSEVKSKLLEIGARGNIVEEVIAQLITENLLNEERFAKAFAGGKFRVNHWGRIKIKQALHQKRVSDYCIKKGLQEIDEEDYENKLRQLAEKKYDSLKKEQYLKRKFKTQQYLMQKGFEPDIVKQIVEQVIQT